MREWMYIPHHFWPRICRACPHIFWMQQVSSYSLPYFQRNSDTIFKKIKKSNYPFNLNEEPWIFHCFYGPSWQLNIVLGEWPWTANGEGLGDQYLVGWYSQSSTPVNSSSLVLSVSACKNLEKVLLLWQLKTLNGFPFSVAWAKIPWHGSHGPSQPCLKALSPIISVQNIPQDTWILSIPCALLILFCLELFSFHVWQNSVYHAKSRLKPHSLCEATAGLHKDNAHY